MTDEELIARLRLYGSKFHHEFGHNEAAADRIEALTAKVKLMDDLDAINGQKIEALEAKLAENEARLGKAVGALDYCINAPFSGWTIAQGYARATLAEIKAT